METILATILGFFAYPLVLGIFGLILCIACTVATEKDIHGFAIFTAIVATIVYFKYIVTAFGYWQFLLLGLAVYTLIGGCWSVYRWFRYCREYIDLHPLSSVDDIERYDYINGQKVFLTTEQYYQQKLQPSKHKSKLISWIVYWPWSFVWNIIGDVVTHIYEMFANVYQRTTTAVIRKALTHG
jgi:hypothetical protein